MTRSSRLEPVGTEEMGYGSSIYDNTVEPWGITEGSGEQDGHWATYAGYGTLFDASQYQTGGRRGMMQWRKGWGGQQSRSGSSTQGAARG